MIRLNEVAKKIQNVLNGVDPEVARLNLELPTGFEFIVETEGFHIDRIADMKTGKNFIPVFISSMGGQFNPVPDLMQANYVIPVTFYFPVRFKNETFKLNEYFARAFVGRQLNYGENSGIALSNISVAQYGEIADLDLKQFAEWVKTTYKKQIEVMEPFIQMTISLYLTIASQEFVYGNDAVATLTVTTDDASWNDDDKTDTLTFVQQSLQSHSDPATQQLMGTKESEGLPQATSYASSFSVYIKRTNFYKNLIKNWFSGDSQDLKLTLTLEFLGEEFERVVYIQSVNMVLQKGELATITFSFVKKLEGVEDA